MTRASRWLGASIKRMLTAADLSFALAWLTDSTGNDKPAGANTGDWPYELGLKIAADFPAYTVLWYLWNDTAQDYASPVTIQTGTGGVARSIRFPGTGFSYTLPATAVATPPTDLDVSVHANLDDWTPAAANVLAAHEAGAGNRSWWLDGSDERQTRVELVKRRNSARHRSVERGTDRR